jgi:hypothetical protein
MAKAQKMADKKNYQERTRKTFKGDSEKIVESTFTDKSRYLNFKYDEKTGSLSSFGKEYITNYEKLIESKRGLKDENNKRKNVL